MECFLAGHSSGRRRIEQRGKELFRPARDSRPPKIGVPFTPRAPELAPGLADFSFQFLFALYRVYRRALLGRRSGRRGSAGKVKTRVILALLLEWQFSGETTIQYDTDTPHVRCEVGGFPQEHLGRCVIDASVTTVVSTNDIAIIGHILVYHKGTSQIT